MQHTVASYDTITTKSEHWL